MNSQRKLLEIADKHTATNPAIASITMSIKEQLMIARSTQAQLKAQLEIQDRSLALEDGYHLSLDQAECAQTAAKLGTALSTLATLFTTLACALEGLGEATGY